jgi:GntR family transcriptional repressor for pyruvate dehydrogenase complex
VASLPDAVLRPVRDGNALESTVEHLAKAIRLGVFAEGERLPPERELAERLKIGRATLREAISALRQAGLVRTSRGRRGGTVVLYRGGLQRDGANYLGRVRRAPTEVADALAFRGVVEPGAAQLAASADLSAAQRAWLSEALRASVKVTADGARRLADSRLHLAIATLSGSALLVDAVTQARSLTAELLTDIPVPASNVAHSDAQHAEIVEAVLNGDHLRAHAVMEDHCKATSARLRAFLG